MNHSKYNKSLILFFVLVFMLSIPFWIFGSYYKILLLPGLPIDALIVVCPGLAALIMTFREKGREETAALLKRVMDYKRIDSKIWYIPILLLMPGITILSYFILRMNGVPIPAPRIEFLHTLILCAMFFFGAVAEELGWTGYATDPLQKRFGAFWTGTLLGVIWAVYHYIALYHVHRATEWIIWWSVGTIAMRIIGVWIYNNTSKSVFAVALFHMSINVMWQSFPVNGSYFDPKINGILLALAVLAITMVWGHRRLQK